MPVGDADPISRIIKARRINSELKSTPLAYASKFLADVLAYMPGAIRHQLSSRFYQVNSSIYSNVPGPTETILLFGQKIEKMGGFFANFCNHITFISYRGVLQGTICVDTDVIKKPNLLMQCFQGTSNFQF